MICPRRGEGPFNFPDNDQWEPDDTCSYCGSLNPETLMKRIEAGDVEIIPTDKSYKIYVTNHGGGQKFKMRYRKDCDMGKPTSKCTGPADCIHWFTEDRDQTKFYFQHLGVPQRHRFLELCNENKIKMGYPGHFYVRPFFVK